MRKREIDPGRVVHRIDLTLPSPLNDTYEIFCTIPSPHNARTTLRPKPSVNNNKTAAQKIRNRPPARLKHLLGPLFVNLAVDVNTMTAETISTTPDTVSNSLINSSYRHRLLKVLPTINKNTQHKNFKDDGDQSRSSSGDRLFSESLASFDDQNKSKPKNNTSMWQNLHHPQLTSSKALHIRRLSKQSINSHDKQVKLSNATSIDTLSQESIGSSNEQLHERIEQLTKTYFPSIQQIRNSRANPELINNRIHHLHRVQENNFMPILSRTRAVR